MKYQSALRKTQSSARSVEVKKCHLYFDEKDYKQKTKSYTENEIYSISIRDL